MAQSRIYLGNQTGAASPDVTLALTGQAVTASAGTLGVSHDNALSGQAATASAGTLTPVLSFGLTGSAATGSAGSLSYAASLALTGAEATASAGTLVYGEVEGAQTQGGFSTRGDPYRPRKEDVARLKRLMGFASIREAKRFIREKPEAARMALAVFSISADPDALVDAVLGETLAQREQLKLAADAEALRLMRLRIEDETLTLLLILAGLEW